MATKRLTLELPQDQYEFIRHQATVSGTTVSAMIRSLIERCRLNVPANARRAYRSDPFAQRRGSFEGPPDLASHHDEYLYGQAQAA
jgi:hypothetical protein